ncbi:MAG: protoglobin domain-containing protein [Candidatus Caldarchaeum sp.]
MTGFVMVQQIPGYTYGTREVQQAPVSDEEFSLLKTTVLMTDEDIRYLRMAGEVLRDQVDDVLDLWYGWVGSHKHLVHYFGDRKSGQPIGEYLQAVRRRFGQWILDTCFREYDRDWLNYQYEIGLRHHKTKKNKTDKVDSVEHIPLRYLIAFIVPITATIKPFLSKKGHSQEDVEKMYAAWFKAVTLSVALWSIPYANKGEW